MRTKVRYRKKLAVSGRRSLSIQPRSSRYKIEMPSRSCVHGLLRNNAALRRRVDQLKGLCERTKRYESLFENSPDIVYYLNSEGTFIPLSDSTLDVLGYANVNVQLADYVYQVVHPEDQVEVLTSYYNAITSKERDIKGITFRVIKSNGELLWMELHARINYDKKGEFLEEVGFLRDVSERKQMDEDLMNLNRELEETNQKLQAAYQWDA